MATSPSSVAHFLADGFEAGVGLSVQLEDATLEAPPLRIRERSGLGVDEYAHFVPMVLASED